MQIVENRLIQLSYKDQIGSAALLSLIYTAEKFWHGSDEKSTHTKKNGAARIDFVV